MIENIQVEYSDNPPDIPMKPGVLHIMNNGTDAYMACPMASENGCGVCPIMALRINSSQHPCWTFRTDESGLATLKPSIHMLYPVKDHDKCGCVHFWIRAGKIVWAEKPQCFFQEEAKTDFWLHPEDFEG